MKNAKGTPRRAAEQRTEAALRASEGKYRALYESSRDAIMILEPPTWQFTAGNRTALEMFGAKNEREFTSKKPYELSPEYQPDGKPSSAKALNMINLAMKKGSNFFEWTHRRLNGRDFPATVLLTKTEIGGKKVLQATVRDISEIKQAETTLLFKNALLNAQSETSIDGILVVDADGKVVSLNKRFGEMWGILPRILETKDDQKLLNHILKQLRYPEEFLRKVRYLYGNKNEKSRDGIELKGGRFFDRYSSPLIDDTGRYWGRIWYFRDVTEQEKIKELMKSYAARLESEVRARTKDLAKERKRLEKFSIMKDEFIRNISHELKTPLSVILGSLMELKETIPIRKEKELLNLFEKLERNTDRLSHSVEQIITISLITAEQIKTERIYLKETIDEIYRKHLPLANTKGLNFKVDAEPVVVTGNAALIQLAIDNIIGNAVKFTNTGGVRVRLRASDDTVSIAVTDTGIGIRQADLKRLFDRFFKGDPTMPGTGMGLYIAKEIIEQEGGKISVESKSRHGSTFEITLPRSIEEVAKSTDTKGK